MSWVPWVVAGVVFFIVEIMTPGMFFFACLGLGCLAAGGLAALSGSAVAAWAAFAAASLVSIYLIRPVARRMFRPHPSKMNVDALVGKEARVTEAIEPPQMGMVKLGGELWRAEAEGRIDAGSSVVVELVEGTHVKVKKN